MAVPVALVIGAGVAFYIQWLDWRRLAADRDDDDERRHRRRQLRRRMQVSIMLALIGLGMAGGLFLPQRWPSLFVVYWCAIMAGLVWVAALAIADGYSTYQFWTRRRRQSLVEQARLRAELLRREPEKRNGHP